MPSTTMNSSRQNQASFLITEVINNFPMKSVERVPTSPNPQLPMPFFSHRSTSSLGTFAERA